MAVNMPGRGWIDAVSDLSPQGNWKMPSVSRLSGSGSGLSRMSGSSVTRLFRRGGRCGTARGVFCERDDEDDDDDEYAPSCPDRRADAAQTGCQRPVVGRSAAL